MVIFCSFISLKLGIFRSDCCFIQERLQENKNEYKKQRLFPLFQRNSLNWKIYYFIRSNIR